MKDLPTSKELGQLVANRTYAGEDLEGAAAADHFGTLCAWIQEVAGPDCPYLLLPMRLHLVHLEGLSRHEELLRLGEAYRLVLKRSLALDEIALLAFDLEFARYLRGAGRLAEGERLREQSARRIVELVDRGP